VSNDAVVHIRGENRDLKSSLQDSGNAMQKFGGMVKAAAIAAVAAFAVKKIIDFGRAALDAYAIQEKAERRLESVVRATGGAAGWSSDQMKQYAAELQKVTTFGDETTISAMAVIATFKEIKGKEFARATELAMDLSTVMGTDLKSSSMQLAKALNEPAKGMLMLGRAGVQFTEEQKEMIRTMDEAGDIAGAQNVMLDEMAAQFGGAARDEAKTFSGVMTQLSNRVGDLWEVMGASLAPVLSLLVPLFDGLITVGEKYLPIVQRIGENIRDTAQRIWDKMQPAVEWLNEMFTRAWVMAEMVVESASKVIGEAIDFISGMFFDGLGGTFSWVGDMLKTLQGWFFDAYIGIMVAAENFQTAFTLASNTVVLLSLQAWGKLKHFFTDVLPAVIKWLGENWFNILVDMANIQATVLKNMFLNLLDFVTSTFQLLTTGQGDWKWTPLLEGFESTLTELPKIAARQKSDLEKELEVEIAADTRTLVNAFDEKKAECAKPWKRALKQERAYEIPEGPDRGVAAAGDASGDGKEDKGFDASLEGLVALNRRITQSAASTPEKKIEDEVKRQGEAQVAEQKKTTQAMVMATDEQKKQTETLVGMRVDVKNLQSLGALT